MKKILFSACFITSLLYAQNSVTDIDGNTYEFLNYGTQEWTVENAVNESYRDGTPIPQVTNQQEWSNLTTGAWCYFANNPAKGKLYNWYAIMGIHDNDPSTPNKAFAPNGWHVPTDTDWNTLEEYLIANGYNYDGSSTGNKIAKSLASTSGWAFSGSSGNTNIGSPGNTQTNNNSSGFNALPVGNRSDGGGFGVQDIWSIFWIYNEGISKSRWVYYITINLGTNTAPQRTGLSVRFVQDSDGCSAPAAPTGNEEQTFCEGSTVADLMATGTTIQWYDASTGGNLLDSATALLDGQFMYSSQTVNSCESIDRLSVTISIQDITITASATEVCVGESVQITIDPFISDFSNWATSEPNNLAGGTEHFGLFLSTGRWNDGPDSYTAANCIVESETNLGIVNNFTFIGIFENHYYYVYNGSDGWNNCNNLAVSLGGYLAIINSQLETNFIVSNLPTFYDRGWIGMYQDTNHPDYSEPGGAWFWVDGTAVAMTSNPSTYTWSNGDTTDNISVTPIETTEYWVDVTTNGVTCREYITINVTAPAAPTGNSVQGGCSDFTVGSNNNAFTGENLQWYANPSGGTALPDNHLLVDGTYYYISQTVDGCESIDRFEFQYLAPEPTITIVSPLICEGESATVSVTSSPFVGTATFLWNTGETSETITLSPTESTSYWVDQVYNSGSPENIQTVCRYFFGVAVDQAPDSPISGGDITECETIAPQNLVATVTANTGQTIIWYDALTSGGVVSDPSLNTAGTVTYYAETISDSSGCPSLSRTAVTLTITSIDSPTGDSVQSFCDVSTIADLTVTGDDIQWYDSATGGTLLDDTTVLIDGQLVYASQTLDGCESLDRLGVSVEIDIITDPILITTELNFCLAREATLADLEIDAQGFELEWYDSYTGGTLLGLDTILEDAISYYATLYDMVSGCESLMRLEVIPAVIPCEVIIYNAISLNDNGLNDYMVIENAEYFPFNTLEIFNRDGYLVYNQRKYGVGDNLFRGMANVGGIYSQGSNLPTGSYLYVFTYYNPYEQQEFVKKGFLTINNN